MDEITKEQALALHESGWWKTLTARDIVAFQLFTDRLCMPFGDFHKAVEGALGRSVWTHEFGSSGGLQAEFLGDKPAPSFEQILDLIPADKRIILVTP